MSIRQDEVMVVNNRLTQVGFSFRTGIDSPRESVFACSCGNRCVVTPKSVKSGKTKSCGCLNRENIKTIRRTHGHSSGGKRTKTYQAWKGMIQRCTNQRRPDWGRYGGRGIVVCDRWLSSFELFLEDMGESPVGTSIDRIDNSGNYEPGNCCWATNVEQSKNRRSNVRLTLGSKTMTASEWTAELGLPKGLIGKRLQRGWSPEDAICIPSGNRR